MSDVSCIVDLDTAAMANEPMGAPAVPPKAWFDELPEYADPRNMAGVGVCGDDKGRFWTMIGEADVPYSNVYDDVEAPLADASTSYYMNERAENPMVVLTADGETEEIAAGPIGFGHSPESIVTIDGLYEWHDREWGTAAKERPLARARLFEVDGPDGNRVVVAAGALMADVTWGEALAVMNSEVSPEFMAVYEGDTVVGIEWVTQTLVFQGNTRTSKSTDERVETARAQIRRIEDASKEQISRLRRSINQTDTSVSTPEGGDQMKTTDDVIAALEAGEIDRAQIMKACGDTPCGPCAAAAAEEEEVDNETDMAAELAAVTAERDALLAAEYEAIEIDTTPLRSRINLQSEKQAAVSTAIYDIYDTGSSWSWFIDFVNDTDEVLFKIGTESGQAMYKQTYTIDLESHTAELTGEPTKVVFDNTLIEV